MGRADKSDCTFSTSSGDKSSVSFLGCGEQRCVNAINNNKLCFRSGSPLTACCELFLFCACWVGGWVGGGGDCMNQFRLQDVMFCFRADPAWHRPWQLSAVFHKTILYCIDSNRVCFRAVPAWHRSCFPQNNTVLTVTGVVEIPIAINIFVLLF